MCRSEEVIHKNGTEQAENGTTALARVWQNGTVPCRLCRAVPCAVCAVLLAAGQTEAQRKTADHRAKLAADPRFAGWVAGASK